VQDRQIGRGGRYPALGLHWLLGLVRLAEGDPAEALEEFDREQRLAEPHRLYGREYAAHARLGRGAALLRANRTGEAIDALHGARELMPGHGPTSIGLAIAHRQGGDRRAADAALDQAARAADTLTPARPIEAAVVRAQLMAARGEPDKAAEALEALLQDAPPGFAGWTIPVEPFLTEVSQNERFRAVLRMLAGRAG